jgi:hypothetical protein
LVSVDDQARRLALDWTISSLFAISAANDPRVAAVIIQRPIYGGRSASKDWPAAIVERVWSERERKTREASVEPTYVKVFADSPENAAGEGEQGIIPGEAGFGLRSAAVAITDPQVEFLNKVL